MLNCYYNTVNKESKCNIVMDALLQGWPGAKVADRDNIEDIPSAFWGIIQNNRSIIPKLKEWWFWDMPYHGRWGIVDTCYWRVSKNKFHQIPDAMNCPADRYKQWNTPITKKPQGDNILICPSSETMTQMYTNKNVKQWVSDTVNEIQKHTDRPIKIRYKPRANGTSGPLAEKSAGVQSFQEDCKNAWCVVTSVSLVAVEAQLLGIPTFCDVESYATPVSHTQLSLIETPLQKDPSQWLNNIAYLQYTNQEIASGKAKELIYVLCV